MKEYEALKLENQLCFSLYLCSKEIVRKYKIFLDDIDLTYTQYITMMYLWEERAKTVKEIGERLCLDSGTLTPVLKKLEKKGYIERTRLKEDERILMITVTTKGLKIREQASEIFKNMKSCVGLSADEVNIIQDLSRKILNNLQIE